MHVYLYVHIRRSTHESSVSIHLFVYVHTYSKPQTLCTNTYMERRRETERVSERERCRDREMDKIALRAAQATAAVAEDCTNWGRSVAGSGVLAWLWFSDIDGAGFGAWRGPGFDCYRAGLIRNLPETAAHFMRVGSCYFPRMSSDKLYSACRVLDSKPASC